MRNGPVARTSARGARRCSLTDDPTIVTATTKTDSQGEFEISYDYIQLNEAIYRTEKNGYELDIIGKIELANEIEIYALVDNRKVAYHKMLINKDNIENIIVQGLKTK